MMDELGFYVPSIVFQSFRDEDRHVSVFKSLVCHSMFCQNHRGSVSYILSISDAAFAMLNVFGLSS